jgi:hypothetical protein
VARGCPAAPQGHRLAPAELVATAVHRFAETGRGDVERIIGDHYRLRVGPYEVRFTVDREAEVMEILAVYGPYRKRHPSLR